MSHYSGQILYIGLFRLPDLNAAAQRVMANAKAFRALGFDVVLAEVGDESTPGGPTERLPDYEGFKCYRLPMKEGIHLDHPRLAIRQVTQLLNSMENPRALIAYNYPAVPLARLSIYCKRRKIACLADVTEWSDLAGSTHLISRLAKWVDTAFRMRIIHKRLDALIVISRYLQRYYEKPKGPPVVNVPPLVDVTNNKWAIDTAKEPSSILRLVYAGSPSATKERLDLVLGAVTRAAQSIPVHIDIVGITAEQFGNLYPLAPTHHGEYVTFHGRVSHAEALAHVKKADFSVIIREQSRLTDAGFPTKFVESVTLGTPALVSPHPDLSEILNDGRNGAIVTMADLSEELVRRHRAPHIQVNSKFFDIQNYEKKFTALAEVMERK